MDLWLGQLGAGLVLGMGATGSALGIRAAGAAAAGAWARDSKAGKPLRFAYIILVGAPLSQTIYAMILMLAMLKVLSDPALAAANSALLLGIGFAGGLGELTSAWGQGVIGAAGCRFLSESDGKGLGLIITALGIIETVGIFTMVFLYMAMPKA